MKFRQSSWTCTFLAWKCKPLRQSQPVAQCGHSLAKVLNNLLMVFLGIFLAKVIYPFNRPKVEQFWIDELTKKRNFVRIWHLAFYHLHFSQIENCAQQLYRANWKGRGEILRGEGEKFGTCHFVFPILLFESTAVYSCHARLKSMIFLSTKSGITS